MYDHGSGGNIDHGGGGGGLGISTHTALLGALARGARWEEAIAHLMAIHETPRLKPNSVSYGATISACAKATKWSEALRLFEDMTLPWGVGMSTAATGATITALEKASRWHEALQTFAMAAGAGLVNTIVCNSTLSACASAGRWEECLQLLAHAQQVLQVRPTLISFNAVLHACALGGCWERSLDLLEEMSEKRMQPTAITYTEISGAYSKASLWSSAVELLGEMKRKKVPPDVVCYNAFLSACAQNGAWQAVLQLLEEAGNDNVRPNLSSLNTALAAVATGRNRQSTTSSSTSPELLPTSLDGGIANVGGGVLESEDELGGNWEVGLMLLASFQTRQLTPDAVTYRNITASLVQGGVFDRAIACFREAEALGLGGQRRTSERGRLFDFHDLPRDVAKALASIAVLDVAVEAPLSDRPSSEELIFIVGQGHGSDEHGVVVGPALWWFLENEFEPPLAVRQDPNNPGRLRVSLESINNWATTSQGALLREPE
mmetsp:Transcript_35619/g.75946  ORF Transcript_35619/g.75946 Transcript_35619/m.75946 type:complete len:491 (+) Transcript_35619:238-1710(+)